MAANNSISTDELKSLILQVTTKISGLDSKVTGFSAQILSEIKRGDDFKTELSLSQPEASSSSTQDGTGDSVGSEVNSETGDPERELCTIAQTQLERSSSKTEDNCSGEPTVCTIQNNVLNVQHDTRIHSTFDMKTITVNLPEAEVLQTGNNSKLIINKNDVDFDKFKEEIFDHMNKGNNEILDVLKNFQDQYNKNTKTEAGCPDEVSNTLSFIINEVEKIRKWQKQLVDQGVAISYQIQGVFQSVKTINRSLKNQLSSEKIKNERLQSELNSMTNRTKGLEKEVSVAQEEKKKLQIELRNFKVNNKKLQQQIRRINMSR